MKATIVIILLSVLGIIGYIRCIYQFVTSDFEASYKRELIYGLGTFVPPVGAIIGYINIADKPQTVIIKYQEVKSGTSNNE